MALIKRGTSDGYLVQGSLGTSVTNTTTETTLATWTMAGGEMGDNKQLSFEMRCRLTTLLSVLTGTMRLKFGGSTLVAINGASIGLSLTNEPFKITGRIINDAPNSQDVETVIVLPASGTPLTISRTIVTGSWAIDTTADQTLSLTWQFSGLGVGTLITADRFLMELK